MTDYSAYLCKEIKNVTKLLGESSYHEYGEYIYINTVTLYQNWGGDKVGVALLETGELVYYWNNQRSETIIYEGLMCVGKGRHHHTERLK